MFFSINVEWDWNVAVYRQRCVIAISSNEITAQWCNSNNFNRLLSTVSVIADTSPPPLQCFIIGYSKLRECNISLVVHRTCVRKVPYYEHTNEIIFMKPMESVSSMFPSKRKVLFCFNENNDQSLICENWFRIVHIPTWFLSISLSFEFWFRKSEQAEYIYIYISNVNKMVLPIK